MKIPGIEEIATMMREVPEKADAIITSLARIENLLEEIRDKK